MRISLAPMQGYTEAIFRSAINRIGGIGVFYAPFIRIENGEIRKKYLADIAPENNTGLHVVPQVLANSTAWRLWATPS